MALAEGVSTGDEGDGLLVVHRHAGEGLPDVVGGGDGVRLAAGALRVDVDQAHLDRREGQVQLPRPLVALVSQPLGLGPPVDHLGLPDVLPAAAEPEGLQAHRFDGAVAGEDHQVGPRDLAAVLLLDRPQQPARLVEVGVVGPAVERREALRAGRGAAAAVADAVGAGAVPRHADEQRTVVSVVGRPPVLRVGHQREEVLLHGGQVEALELRGVVEIRAHRIGRSRALGEHLQVELVRPPVPVRSRPGSRLGARSAGDGALAGFVGHHSLLAVQQWVVAVERVASPRRCGILGVGGRWSDQPVARPAARATQSGQRPQ